MTSRYIEGELKGDWITWECTQRVGHPGYFVHSSYFLQGKVLSKTRGIIESIIDNRKDRYRSNMRIGFRKYNSLRWDTISRYIHLDRPYGASFYIGAHPVIMWQNALTGKWMIATGYGVIEGPEVKIHRNYEWRLREKPLIGWIYWMGPGKKNPKYSGLNNMLYNKEIIMPWENVHLDIWGKQSDNGIYIGGTNWEPLYGMNDMMEVGGEYVIRNPAPTGDITQEYREWAEETVYNGAGLLYMTPRRRGNDTDTISVWQLGIKRKKLTMKEWADLLSEVTINIEHDDDGRITYQRTT